jgi:hypothetical protein
MGAVAVAALSTAAPHAAANINLWAIGNAAGDASKTQTLIGFEVFVDFNAGTGNLQLISSVPVVDQNGLGTSNVDAFGAAWNPGLGYVNGRIYASNQFNSVTPSLLTGEVDPNTGVYRGISDQGASDPNPIPGLGPINSAQPRSNGLVASFAGNPPGQGNQNLVVGITQDAVQYGFNADTENAIGNVGPAPLGFNPVQDVEGLGTDAANDIAYVIDDRAGNVPLLLEAINPSGPGLNITVTPLPFLGATLDNFGLTYDPGNDALIISATSTNAFGNPDTLFYAVNPSDLTDVVQLPTVFGSQIGGLAAVPAPGALGLIGIAGASALRRRR